MEKSPDGKVSMQKSEKKAKKKSNNGSVLGKAILAIGLILFVMIIGVGCGFLTASLNTRPNLAEDIVPPASSQIYDINGNEIANIHAAENRRPVGINEIPKRTIDSMSILVSIHAESCVLFGRIFRDVSSQRAVLRSRSSSQRMHI